MANYTDEIVKALNHCQSPVYITNRYSGNRVRVDCGQCDYCIHKKAMKKSMAVKVAGSKFKYCWFVTLTYDQAHLPLFKCEVVDHVEDFIWDTDQQKKVAHTEHYVTSIDAYDDIDDLRCIRFTQVQGTVPFNRETKAYEPVSGHWYITPSRLRNLINKATPDCGFESLDTLPFLNYVDVQNYIKRLRKHIKTLGCDEKISFYAVGEYGPIHFRPHFHLLLFANSDKVAEVVRQAHSKSWKFGRSDLQLAAGGASSYVAGYVNSLASIPFIYRSCPLFKPSSRSSIGFFAHDELEDEASDDEIAQVYNYCFNGKRMDFDGVVVKATPPMSYISAVYPRFCSAGSNDNVKVSRIIRATANVFKKLYKLGYVYLNEKSTVSQICVAYLDYIKSDRFARTRDDDDILLFDACRSLGRYSSLLPTVDLDAEYSRVYRHFLKVSKFYKYWNLSADTPLARIIHILNIGSKIYADSDYENLKYQYSLMSQASEMSLHYSYLLTPDNGLESDFRVFNEDFEKYLRSYNLARTRSMVKHKELNDCNKQFLMY